MKNKNNIFIFMVQKIGNFLKLVGKLVKSSQDIAN